MVICNQCKFCKRPLKAEKSIKRGYGEVCGKKHGMIIKHVKKEQKYKNLFEVE